MRWIRQTSDRDFRLEPRKRAPGMLREFEGGWRPSCALDSLRGDQGEWGELAAQGKPICPGYIASTGWKCTTCREKGGSHRCGVGDTEWKSQR